MNKPNKVQNIPLEKLEITPEIFPQIIPQIIPYNFPQNRPQAFSQNILIEAYRNKLIKNDKVSYINC